MGGTYLSRAVLRQLIGQLSSGGDREGSSDGDDHSGAESLVVCRLAAHGHVDILISSCISSTTDTS